MSQYGISMQLTKVNEPQANRFSLETEGDRYRCRFTRPGKKVQLYVTVPPAEEESLTPSDVLFMLILDASGCEMFKDYYARHDEFNEIISNYNSTSDVFDEFWVEYESRCEQSRKLRAFLGNNLYEELIGKFGFDN